MPDQETTALLLEASAPTPLVTVKEYLTSIYQPDMDYVEGILKERNI